MHHLSIWKKSNTKELLRTFIIEKTPEETQRFLRDLLTEHEIEELALRWKVARMLHTKTPYEKIEKQTHMSSTTIARIHKWMKQGTGGYKLMLNKLKK